MTTPELPRRFVAQPDDTGHSYTVWDTVLHAFRTTGQTRAQAEQLAADLELQYDAWGPRPAAAIRPVKPAVDVDVAVWQPAGRLDCWLRERIDQSLTPQFGWYGRVRTIQSHYLWLPAENLRQTGKPAK